MKTDSNPKTVHGNKKSSTCFTPQPVIHEIGLAFLEGALKYGPYNWRENAITASTYYDAIRRHLDAWWEGENWDADSGVSHLVKAAACLILLRDAQRVYKLNDDRPFQVPGVLADFMTEANEAAAAVRAGLETVGVTQPEDCEHEHTVYDPVLDWIECSRCDAVKAGKTMVWRLKPGKVIE